ncbi:hypothetical protein [Nocardiopsis synnemataformans]|uniref:hypothetical protein n=1 Tax=Nocardiopsis synnemataformans TaxID=61305 RepID=UPI003EB98DA1
MGQTADEAKQRTVWILNEYHQLDRRTFKRLGETPLTEPELRDRLSEASVAPSTPNLQAPLFDHYRQEEAGALRSPNQQRALQEQCRRDVAEHVHRLLRSLPSTRPVPMPGTDDLWFVVDAPTPLIGKVRLAPLGGYSCYAPWIVRMRVDTGRWWLEQYQQRQMVTSAALQPTIARMTAHLLR